MKWSRITVWGLAALLVCGCGETRSNKYLKVTTGGDGVYRLYRVGESSPFAEVPKTALDRNAEVEVRLEGDAPFVYFDVSPRVDFADFVPGKLDFGPVKLTGTDVASWRMMGSGGLTNIAAEVGSYAFLAVAEPKSRRGYVAAWLTGEWASGSVFYGPDGLKAKAEYGPMLVKKGSARKADTFVIGAFDDCRLGLEAYADAIARHYGIELPRQMSGFTTWYSDKGGFTLDRTRFESGACSEKMSREFIDKVVGIGLPEWGFGYYQIDDKWQDGVKNPGPSKIFCRVDPKGPYPDGMKPTAEYVSAHGLVPGIWCMPFSGEPSDPWWQDKMDIFVTCAIDAPAKGMKLEQAKGKPYATCFGAGALDMSNPKAIAYVKDIIARITREWGYRLIKFDGMYTGMAAEIGGFGGWYKPEDIGERVFNDVETSNARAFRLGLKAMREASAEGTQFLACNVKQNARGIVASYGLVEMLRIGGDNGPIDSFPERYMAGPIDGSPRYFLNGRTWYNDPDPVYVRDAVPLGRARLMASWTSLGGLLYNFSDWPSDLSAGRVEILKRTLAPHRKPLQVRPIDYFERNVHNVWKLTDAERAVFGLYNWDTNDVLKINYDAAYCDLDPRKTHVGFDFWENKFIPAFGGRFAFDVPIDSCRIIAVRELLDHPFVISTSRHVASPIFDVSDERWDPSAKTLSGNSAVVPGEAYELRLVVPSGLIVKCALGGKVVREGELVRITFDPAEKALAWKVSFL